MKVPADRYFAYKVLFFILIKHKSFDIAFNQLLLDNPLNERDKLFAYNLVKTTLRNLEKIKYLIKLHSFKTIKKKQVLVLLYLCIAEIICLNKPLYAVTSSYLSILAREHFIFAKKFFFILLKKIDESKETEDIPIFDNWLLKRIKKLYGNSIVIPTSSKINFINLCFKSNLLDLIKNELKKGPYTCRQLDSNNLLITNQKAIFQEDWFLAGSCWVQNYSISLLMGILDKIVKGKNVIDMCSAPGGKTFQLYNLGAKKVSAIDISAKRLDIMQQNLNRLQLNDFAELLCLNALDLDENQKFSCVILDVPCSATGTIIHNPDVIYTKSSADIAKLIEQQKKLLAKGAKILKISGYLLYINCSLLPEEGEEIIDDFLKKNNNFIKVNPSQFSSQITQYINKNNYIRILPHDFLDGFFASLLYRNS